MAPVAMPPPAAPVDLDSTALLSLMYYPTWAVRPWPNYGTSCGLISCDEGRAVADGKFNAMVVGGMIGGVRAGPAGIYPGAEKGGDLYDTMDGINQLLTPRDLAGERLYSGSGGGF